MKRSGTTAVYVLIWSIVLVGAYGLGVCIREYRFRQAKLKPPTAVAVQKPSVPAASQRLTASRMPARGASTPEETPSSRGRSRFGSGRTTGGRPQFGNMSDEQRQQAMSQMRDRFGGRRRGQGMPQLSDADREKMRADIEDLRNRWDSMSEEERQQAQEQMRQKYGFAPRGFGGSNGFGGGGFGGRRGGRGGSQTPDGQ